MKFEKCQSTESCTANALFGSTLCTYHWLVRHQGYDVAAKQFKQNFIQMKNAKRIDTSDRPVNLLSGVQFHK